MIQLNQLFIKTILIDKLILKLRFPFSREWQSGDILIKDIDLPHTEAGDILVVSATGAYNYSMASNYNRIGRPAAVLVNDGDASLIIRRETYQDLVRQDLLPSRLG